MTDEDVEALDLLFEQAWRLQGDPEIDEEAAEPQHTVRPAGRTPRSTPQAEAEPGMPLLSHRDFHLLRLIGAGRMGKVYEARQQGMGRQVAVKFLRNSLLQHPDEV